MTADDNKIVPSSTVDVARAAVSIANIIFDGMGLSISLPFLGARNVKSIEEQKSDLVSKLLAAGIDPLVFDILLSNEIDRRLKTRFGIAFIILTFLFTAASYCIVILNGPMQLRISDNAITGLIIETPIQFVGLLYIIARNLFPDGKSTKSLSSKSRKLT